MSEKKKKQNTDLIKLNFVNLINLNIKLFGLELRRN